MPPLAINISANGFALDVAYLKSEDDVTLIILLESCD